MESTGTSKSSGRNTTVTFEYFAPDAKQVQLAGSFNNWNANSALLKKDRNGRWEITLALPLGRHEYRYVVDGKWQNDQKPVPTVRNPFGGYNSIIEVAGKPL